MALGSSVQLEQFIALNDEMGAMIRAGVPLEKGLRILSEEQLGRVASLAAQLSDRMDAGGSLEEALEAESGSVPPLYLAVVRAGLRSGRLAAALEGLSEVARDYAEGRRLIGLALLYPVLLLICSYVLFVAFIASFAGRFIEAFETLRLPFSWPIRFLRLAHDTLPFWVGSVPLALMGLLLWWVASGRSSALSGGGSGALSWIPGFRRMIRDGEAANFASLLALLSDHGVPLDHALRIASEAVGDRALRDSATHLAGRIVEGRGAEEGDRTRSDAIPPLLSWILISGRLHTSLPDSLRNAAATYRTRSKRKAERMRQVLPALFLFTIGGAIVLTYVVSIVLPLSSLWQNLGQPPSDF